jgi:ribosomal protein S18 acetylase RimI-like enzyme
VNGVRTAGPDDLDALAPLFLGYLDFYDEVAEDAAARSYLAKHLGAGTSTILLAERGGLAVGFAQLYPTWESLSLTSRWILYDLFVEPGARRVGVGRALVTAALDHARASGAGSLSLETARDNAPAQALYQALGFERDDVFVTYHHGLESPDPTAGSVDGQERR